MAKAPAKTKPAKKKPKGSRADGKGFIFARKIEISAGAIAAVAGAVAAVLALLPNDGPKPVPDATLLVTRFEPNVPLGEFERRFPADAAADDATGEPTRPGGTLQLDLSFRDFGRRTCTLSWTVFNAANQDPLPNPDFVNRKAAQLELDSSFEHFTPAVWVPAPTRVEDVYVLFTLADKSGPCGSPFRSETLSVE